jgi:predicted nucleic-acid-binding Zn-ribbon protein
MEYEILEKMNKGLICPKCKSGKICFYFNKIETEKIIEQIAILKIEIKIICDKCNYIDFYSFDFPLSLCDIFFK